jgi:hypothetical protein
MRRQTKEIPNTKNVVVWPEDILKQIRIVEAYDRAEARESEISSRLDKNDTYDNKRVALISENFEYYIFLIIGSAIWIFVARAILKWQKFPFHRHMVEVCLIYTCPILIIIVLLYFVDFGTRRSRTKESFEKQS